MATVDNILFGALQATGPTSSRRDVVAALEAQQPNKDLNFEHAVQRVQRWEDFMEGEQPFRLSRLPPTLPFS